MIKGFWKKLHKPIMALAPMANVTDAAFRKIIAKYGKPDVLWTEFVSCDGLCSEGKNKLTIDLKFTQKERPVVAQIFGAKPENFYRCARLLRKLGFDGIDINMGCPDRSVEKQGAGAALIKNPKLAIEIIQETKRGAGPLPVSVKTRTGYNADTLENWLPAILTAQPAAVILHARTRKQMSKVAADWGAVTRAAKMIKALGKNRPLLLGNGDVQSLEEAKLLAKQTGADGIMIGRGIFGNPWLFTGRKREQITTRERLKVLLEHARLFEKIFKNRKKFDNMKKHFKAYVSDFPGAKELRIELMSAHNIKGVESVVDNFMKK